MCFPFFQKRVSLQTEQLAAGCLCVQYLCVCVCLCVVGGGGFCVQKEDGGWM